jgi:anti-sigma factor RsiW
MRHCRFPDLLLKVLPWRPWQDWLIRRHMERCPACRARLVDRDEARQVLYEAEDVRSWTQALSVVEVRAAGIPGLGTSRPRGGFVLSRAAAAAALVVLAATLSVFFFRGFRVEQARVHQPQSVGFELDYVRVGGRPARSYIFQSRDPSLTLVWVEKGPKEGVS